MRERLQQYLSTGVDVADPVPSLRDGQQEATDRALATKDIARSAYAHAGRAVADRGLVERASGTGVTRSTWDHGRELGHPGAGDRIAGLGHLLGSKAAEPGDKVVLSGVGAGSVPGCAVLEIVARPSRA